MKIKILVLLAALLLVGGNLYAAPGDLVVNGNLTVGGTVSAPTVSVPHLLTKFYETEQPITQGGFLTLAHGLGTTPVLIQVWLKCVATGSQTGYAVGDMFPVPVFSDVLSYVEGCSIRVDNTNLYVRFGTQSNYTWFVPSKGTGARVGAEITKFTVVIRAWAM
jgi:hypothetical protein